MTTKTSRPAVSKPMPPQRRRWPKITSKEFQSLRFASGRYCGLIEEKLGHHLFQDVWVDRGFVYDLQKKRLIHFQLETHAVNQKEEFGVENANHVDRYKTELVILDSKEQLNYRFYVTHSKFWSAGLHLEFGELHASAEQAHLSILLKLGKLPPAEIRGLVEKPAEPKRPAQNRTP